MSAPVRRGGGLLDPRLARRAAATRQAFAAAVAVGLGITGCLVVQAVLLASVVDQVLVHRATLGTVTPALCGLGATVCVRAVLVWAGEVAAHHSAAAVTSTLRRQLLDRIVERGPRWLAGERTGELALTATQGVRALDRYFSRFLPQLVLAGIAPVAILVWIAWADWVSLVVLVCTIAMIPVFMVLLGLHARDRTETQWARAAALGARFLDLVQGLPTLRAFGQVGTGRRSVERASDDLRCSTLETLRVAFLSAFALELLASIGTALVALFLGIRLVHGTMSLGVALAVLVLAPEVYLPLRKAAAEFHASAEGQAAASRVLDVLDEAEVTGTGSTGSAGGAGGAGGGGGGGDAADSLGTSPSAVGAARVADPARATLAFRHVTVTHPGRARPALDDVDLVVSPGEHVAIEGESGAGKSTLLSVALGFVVPDAGAFEIGGVDLATVCAEDWLRHVAWVPQRPYLVRASLRANVLLGAPAGAEARLDRALGVAGLAELVRALPQGTGTVVGEGGTTLSAGERQRVALARAVVRDAPVLLLDEPADHLDDAGEAALRAELDRWLEGRTVLVAAHRRRLVERVDRVVRLAAGRLVGETAASGVAA